MSKVRVKDSPINGCVLNGVRYTTAGSYTAAAEQRQAARQAGTFEKFPKEVRDVKCDTDKCISSSANDILLYLHQT